ncbi:prepilin peptidase [Arthrobacter crystallopoietes]|uniref:Leader peptidase (Prepilin peptidase) / N-methyltransferase n=1 Tax=Crystallibacter crystallopoietes TaxID=37928 RepID=A0A1H1F3C0_9MICC|nr:A24 family peptidase [Arthrobacter crystallopoietes]SDQ95299.1 leader peptidase (prepilin peptidase) / N-methyltransferase [Arthrobacter crystallopoietes]
MPLALLSGFLCGLLVWIFDVAPILPALLYLAVLGVLLGAIDARHKLLPNRLVLPFLLGALCLLGIASLISGTWLLFLGGVLGGAAMFVVYLIMALIKPGGMGMGDVKLAAVVGLYAGYLGLNAWLLVLVGAFILNAVAILVLMLGKVLTRKLEIPFGPSMIAATLMVPLVSGVG